MTETRPAAHDRDRAHIGPADSRLPAIPPCPTFLVAPRNLPARGGLMEDGTIRPFRSHAP